MIKQKTIITLLRLAMGFIFLWAFLDKLFGLGFATAPEKAWVNGGSPTTGFLTNATQGPFAEHFQSLAGLVAVDWIFMLGLLFVGVTLIANRFIKIGAGVGCLMMLIFYLSLLWPANNPFLDDHIIYILVLILIAKSSDRQTS